MTTAEKTSPEDYSRSTTAVQGQSAGVHQKWLTLALGRHLHIVPRPGPGPVIVFETNSTDTAATQTDIKNEDTHLLNS